MWVTNTTTQQVGRWMSLLCYGIGMSPLACGDWIQHYATLSFSHSADTKNKWTHQDSAVLTVPIFWFPSDWVSSRASRPNNPRCVPFVSFENLSVKDFHGWEGLDYQNIYLNCHNIPIRLWKGSQLRREDDDITQQHCTVLSSDNWISNKSTNHLL